MQKLTLKKAFPYILIIGGIIGLICSFTLTYDTQQIALNPSYQPSCNLNPIISCGNIAKSAQGTIIGNIPNPWWGMMAFPVVITLGVVLLAGGTFKRWFWLAVQGGATLGVIAVHWFFYQSVYTLNELCPFCLGVWAVTIPLFWYTTLYNFDQGILKLPKDSWQKVAGFARQHHIDLLVLWILIIAALILKHFWYYYGHYF
ncbi:MAG TPA: vitamin K epoxide reductase family protein [Candidatus Saccharimonadales bacterium]|nr:vitamin K epoxide reductase family protein [Candidatus Saccharimonadales bacterium]